MPPLGLVGHDRQAEEDAVGIGQVDGRLFRAALAAREPHVPPDDLDACRLPCGIAKASRRRIPNSCHRGSASRRCRARSNVMTMKSRSNMPGLSSAKELVLFAIQFHQPLDGVSVLKHLRERRKTRFGVAAGCAAVAAGMETLPRPAVAGDCPADWAGWLEGAGCSLAAG